jgi:hypothetical protein
MSAKWVKTHPLNVAKNALTVRYAEDANPSQVRASHQPSSDNCSTQMTPVLLLLLNCYALLLQPSNPAGKRLQL